MKKTTKNKDSTLVLFVLTMRTPREQKIDYHGEW